jgi:hypothetical protein
MPLGLLLHFAGLFVFPALGGGDTQVADSHTGGHGLGIRILTEVADENDFVDATRHVEPFPYYARARERTVLNGGHGLVKTKSHFKHPPARLHRENPVV